MFPPQEQAPDTAFAGAANTPDAGGAGVQGPVPAPPMQLPPSSLPPWVGTQQDPRMAAVQALTPSPQTKMQKVLGALMPAIAAAFSFRGGGLGSFMQGYQGAENQAALAEDRRAQAVQRRAVLLHQMMLEHHAAEQERIAQRKNLELNAAAAMKNAEKAKEDRLKATNQAWSQTWKDFTTQGGVDAYNQMIDDKGLDYAKHWAGMTTAKGPFQTSDGQKTPMLQELFDKFAYVDPNTGKIIKQDTKQDQNPQVVAFAKSINKTPSTMTWKDWQKFNEQEAASKKSPDQDDTPLTPAATDMLALQLAKTGTFSYSGIGKTAVANRNKVYNRAAELYKGLDLGSQKAGYAANAKSLSQLTTQFNNVSQFANTAHKNAQMLLDAASKVTDTGSGWLNKPISEIQERGLGDVDRAYLRTARDTVVPEFARILQNPNLNGALTDSARQEIAKLIDPSTPLAQITKIVETLEQENQNRIGSMKEQMNAVKQILAIAPGEAQPQLGSDYVATYDPATGGLVRR